MRTIKQIACIILSSVAVSGCVLTDEFKEELVSKSKEDRVVDELMLEVEYIKELRPQILRMIELEGDLSFLVDSMQKNKNDTSFGGQSNTDTSLQPNLASVIDMKPLPKSSTDNEFLEIAQTPTAIKSIELGIAKPVVSMQDLNNNTDSIDQKFSGASFAALQSSNNDTNNARSNDDFINNDCNADISGKGELSMHLASYTTVQNAKRGWETLSDKHQDALCGLQAVIADVNVNGVDYLSLRVGPFNSVETVNLLCQKIREKGDYCSKATFAGRSL